MACRFHPRSRIIMSGMFVCYTTFACALRWGVALVGDYSTGHCSPRRGIPLSGTGSIQGDDAH